MNAPILDPARFDAFQLAFHERFANLHDPDVRALAWVLTAPDLFDPALWQGRVGSVPQIADLDHWLHQQQAAPEKLKQEIRPGMRLGRYAEHLMAHYLREQGWLEVQGLQVRLSKEQTIGEFDFLWRDHSQLVHWEFATKFYLYHAALGHDTTQSGYFVGPNLADSLDAKMGKILHRQLALASHPAAQPLLPRPIDRAEALVKGWLFYRPDQAQPELGLSANHCRGFWCSDSEFADEFARAGETGFVILPRQRWLAPVRLAAGAGHGALDPSADNWPLLERPLLNPPALDLPPFDQPQLQAQLAHHFAKDNMPLLVACLQAVNGEWLEARRAFVVPNDWQQRAAGHQRPARQWRH